MVTRLSCDDYVILDGHYVSEVRNGAPTGVLDVDWDSTWIGPRVLIRHDWNQSVKPVGS